MAAIWITGGKGFIGRHVAKVAAANGFEVFGIGHGLWSADDAAEWSYSHWSNGEIEPANLSQLLRVSGWPDTIFHLAGGSSVGTSLDNPHEDFSRTVETTARLLEWVRLNSPKSKVVSVSSAAVYGSRHVREICEDAIVSPYSPYGFHKAMMEGLCQSYCASFNLQIAIVRLFSVYGPRLEKQLIWDLCGKLASSNDRPVGLGGTGNEIRDWLHVFDAAKLLWMARLSCGTAGPVINGGTGIGISIAEIAQLVCGAWNSKSVIEFNGRARKGDPLILVADVSRASDLGFQPAISLESGICETVGWFKQHRGRSLSA
jgi:UDP-glucose 4-epimerase